MAGKDGKKDFQSFQGSFILYSENKGSDHRGRRRFTLLESRYF